MAIKITEVAAGKIREAMEQAKGSGEPYNYFRIYVQGGGCSGFTYGLALDDRTAEDEQNVKDTPECETESNGVKILTDPMSLRYLNDVEIDYKSDGLAGGFVVHNPDAKTSCGCGHSFSSE